MNKAAFTRPLCQYPNYYSPGSRVNSLDIKNMADKNINKVHEIYRVLFKRSWPCNFSHPFAPLVISNCNADGNIPFSKAAMNVRAVHDCAVAELFLYRGAYYDIVERETPRSKQALECLGQYLNDGKQWNSLNSLNRM